MRISKTPVGFPPRKVGDVVDYHGRPVEIVELAKTKAPISGDVVELVRVQDPRRGMRAMFRWQLEQGIGAKPEKALAPDRDDASFA